jgi:hypothetical protein
MNQLGGFGDVTVSKLYPFVETTATVQLIEKQMK